MFWNHSTGGPSESLLKSKVSLHRQPLLFPIAEVVLRDCCLDGLPERLFALPALRGRLPLNRLIDLHELLGNLLDLFEINVAFFVKLQSRLLNKLVYFLIKVVVPVWNVAVDIRECLLGCNCYVMKLVNSLPKRRYLVSWLWCRKCSFFQHWIHCILFSTAFELLGPSSLKLCLTTGLVFASWASSFPSALIFLQTS